MRTLAHVAFAMLLLLAAATHAQEQLASPLWIYASKLDLTCPDPAECFKKEGKDIRWFRVGTDDAAHAPAGKARGGDRDSVPIQFLWPQVFEAKGTRNDRALIAKGRRLGIGYVYPLQPDGTCKDASVTFSYEEKERPTALMAGFARVVTVLPDLRIAQAGMLSDVGVSPPKADACITFQYKALKEDRAAVKMTYTPTGAKETEASSHVLITGGKEHLFFTGDILVKKVSELKFDKDTHTFSKKEKPERVYLGLNYQLGDVYTTAPTWSKDRIIAKVMVRAASRPLDSVGVGVGYQLKDFLYPTGGTDAGAIHVYAGHYWTKGDEGPRNKEWRVGLSFNIDTLIGWVKPASK